MVGERPKREGVRDSRGGACRALGRAEADVGRYVVAEHGRFFADQQRDYVEVWNERLRFDLRHNPQNSPSVKQAARIYNLLKGLGQPIRLNA